MNDLMIADEVAKRFNVGGLSDLTLKQQYEFLVREAKRIASAKKGA